LGCKLTREGMSQPFRLGNPPGCRGHNKGEIDMQYALIYAFVVVAGAPLIGIWRGHVWAKANGMVLRTTATSEQNQTA
jgi:hypothetical protein